MKKPSATVQRVILVGGGHAHVQVLRSWAMAPPRGARLTVVLDTPVAVYSGMVPGLLAGMYRREELEIDVVPLARRAGAQVILAAAVGVDRKARRIHLAGRPAIAYDVASFDIGSTVAGLDLPGVRRFALPTRPIGSFARRLDELLTIESAGSGPIRLLVVGGGAGGVEVAFCAQIRLESLGRPSEITLIESGPRVLRGYPESLARRVETWAERRRVRILAGRRVEAIEEGSVRLAGGERLDYDAVVWVTGAVAPSLFRDSGLTTDERGFLQVGRTLQSRDAGDLFAVGDCATLTAYPELPKAGVYAVRQGPVISHNLAAFVEGRALRRYRPQRDFLTLLNLGGGDAVGAKWGLSVGGRWVMKLKDRIDRRFMRRFQVLDDEGGLREEFAALPAMPGAGAMLCGGCAAKVGRGVLDRALERLGPGPEDPSVELGLAVPDDAAAWELGDGRRVVTSVDAFKPFTDDPYLVGRVAAVNALSDLEAKGVRPRYALALVAVPEAASDGEREELLYQVLSGARAAFDPLAVSLVGGHSTTAADLLVGFTVEGVAESGVPLLVIGALRQGDRLVLSRPLGTGVLFHADMQGRASGPWIETALAGMQRSNRAASRIAREAGAAAATDVTGFGLAGHLAEMTRASGLAAVIELDTLPALPGALELFARGLRSTFHPDNERAARAMRFPAGVAAHPRLPLLFDPQTSGGLLFGVRPERLEWALSALDEAGETAAAIGRITAPQSDGALIRLVTCDRAAARAAEPE